MLNLNYIKYEMHDDGIAFINLNNKPVNSLKLNLLDDLDKVINYINDNDKCRLVIFRSLQKHFSAGADLKERKQMSYKETYAFLEKINNIFNRIEDLKVPTIASINGAALGGGLELALCCDFRVASESAYLSLPETSLGVIPGAGGIFRLGKLIGVSKAKYWVFTAQKFSSESAYQDGVVDFLSKDNELLGVTLEIAQEILGNAPLAIKASKKLFNEYYKSAHDLEDFQSNRALSVLQKDAYSIVMESEDKKEAIEAFLSKRKPTWKGK
jgi:enoyl-CoA hydratase/carnithine racemase